MVKAILFPAHVKQAVLDGLSAGQTLKAVCAAEGMPTTTCIHQWARKDWRFALDMETARQAGERRRRGLAPEEAKCREILRRVAEGEPLHKILQSSPHLPSRKVLAQWRTQDIFFDTELRGIWSRRREGLPRRARRDYDPRIADRILVLSGQGWKLRDILRSDKAFPCLSVLERWRKAEPEFDRDLKVCMRVGVAARTKARVQALRMEIVEALLDGASLRSLAGRWRAEGRTDRPSLATLYKWVRERPDLVADIELACEMRDEMMFDDQYAMSKAATNEDCHEVGRAIRQLEARRRRLAAKVPGARWRSDPGILE